MSQRNVQTRRRDKWASAVIALAGLVLLVAPLVADPVIAGFWNDVVIGLLLLGLGGYNYYRLADGETGSTGAAALAALLGLWLAVSPFVYQMGEPIGDLTGDARFWYAMIIGLLTFLLGAYSVYEFRGRRRAVTTEGEGTR